jgi:hypothetical protein
MFSVSTFTAQFDSSGWYMEMEEKNKKLINSGLYKAQGYMF